MGLLAIVLFPIPQDTVVSGVGRLIHSSLCRITAKSYHQKVIHLQSLLLLVIMGKTWVSCLTSQPICNGDFWLDIYDTQIGRNYITHHRWSVAWIGTILNPAEYTNESDSIKAETYRRARRAATKPQSSTIIPA